MSFRTTVTPRRPKPFRKLDPKDRKRLREASGCTSADAAFLYRCFYDALWEHLDMTVKTEAEPAVFMWRPKQREPFLDVLRDIDALAESAGNLSGTDYGFLPNLFTEHVLTDQPGVRPSDVYRAITIVRRLSQAMRIETTFRNQIKGAEENRFAPIIADLLLTRWREVTENDPTYSDKIGPLAFLRVCSSLFKINAVAVYTPRKDRWMDRVPAERRIIVNVRREISRLRTAMELEIRKQRKRNGNPSNEIATPAPEGSSEPDEVSHK